MLKSGIHFIHTSESPKAHEKRSREASEGPLKGLSDHHGLPTHTYLQTHTWESLWGHFFSHSPLHLFIPFPHSSSLTCLRESESSAKEKKKKGKQKKRGWIWAEKHPLGLFPFIKELLQISCLIHEGGLRRDTSWHDRQSPSLFGKRGSDRTRGDMPVPIRAPGCHRLVNSWGRNQPFHWNQSVVN